MVEISVLERDDRTGRWKKQNGGGKRMDVKKELESVFREVLSLPLDVQDVVVEDIVESARNRVRTIKRILKK